MAFAAPFAVLAVVVTGIVLLKAATERRKSKGRVSQLQVLHLARSRDARVLRRESVDSRMSEAGLSYRFRRPIADAPLRRDCRQGIRRDQSRAIPAVDDTRLLPLGSARGAAGHELLGCAGRTGSEDAYACRLAVRRIDRARLWISPAAGSRIYRCYVPHGV